MRLRLGSLLAILASGALLWTTTALAQEEQTEEEEEEQVEAETADDAADDDEAMDNMIITGSYIRRDNFDTPSPIDIITELDIELAGTPDLGDIIFDQTYQVGVNANAAPFEHPTGRADDQSVQRGVEVWANIRGLGTRATMTMMDSHRVPANVQGYGPGTRRSGSDVNSLYPGIAIGRVETILDGASALYGSEAVSGVVNVIPQKNFDGFRANYSSQQAIEGGAPSKSFELLAGAQSEKSSAIFAMAIRDVDRMEATERPQFIISSAGWTGQLLPTWSETGSSNPGDWRVPFRGSNGELVPWTPSGWAQFPTSTPPPGWIATSGPWYLYPEGEPIRLVVDDYDNDGLPDVEEFGYAGTVIEDTQGRMKVLRRVDPGCGYDFGAGYNSLEGERFAAGSVSAAGGLGYTDTTRKGNFLNEYLTGNVWGRETRTTGDEAGSHGSEYDCRRVTTDFQDMQTPQDREQGMAFFEHRFNDYVSFHGEVTISRLESRGRQNDWFGIDEWQGAAGEDTLSPFIPYAIGSNPGNPFRAFADGSNTCDLLPNLPGCDEFTNGRWYTYVDDNGTPDNPADDVTRTIDRHSETELSYIDANGNGVYDYLQEAGEWLVFAQDINGDGLPDRDVNGDGIAQDSELNNREAQHSAQNRVILLPLDSDVDGDGIPDRFDPDSHGTIGVRLFEDVRLDQLAAHPKQPYVHESYPWLNGDMSFDHRAQLSDMRLRLGATIEIPDTEWYINADWVWALNKRENDWLEPIWHWAVNSFRCSGGRDGQQCFNPFSTSWLASDPESGELLPQWRDKDDPAWNTTLETRNAGIIPRADQRLVGFVLVDVIASNSNLFNLWYNDAPVGFAIGMHHRIESEEYRPNQVGAASLGSSIVSFQYTEEQTDAVFTEFRWPLISHPRWGEMEVQTALRYAEFTGRGSLAATGEVANFDVTIPKFAMSYTPTRNLSWRFSRTEGFVLPGMFQLFNVTDGEYSSQETVRDYICDNLPELPMCSGVGPGGAVPDVTVIPESANRNLSAEISALWNTGLTFRMFDDDFTMDIDYTDVAFEGRVERIGVGAVVNQNEAGFEQFIKDRCGNDTLVDYDNQNKYPIDQYPNIPRNPLDYVAQTPLSEQQCRLEAANEWIAQETTVTGGVIIREDGRLVQASNAWINQGEYRTRTLIAQGGYSFEGAEIPFIGGDYGNFNMSFSMTKMLELSLTRFAADSGHGYAGLKVDGVGNRNATNFWAGSELGTPLPPTPEYRINLGLRWFTGPHTAQLSMRWHDSITDVSPGYDEITEWTKCRLRPDGSYTRNNGDQCSENEYLTDPNGWNNNEFSGMAVFNVDDTDDIPNFVWTEKEACIDQDRNPYCEIPAAAYWDFSYTYNRTNFMGMSSFSINVSIRNLFDYYPTPIPSGVGFEAYVDNGMGRLGFARVSMSL